MPSPNLSILSVLALEVADVFAAARLHLVDVLVDDALLYFAGDIRNIAFFDHVGGRSKSVTQIRRKANSVLSKMLISNLWKAEDDFSEVKPEGCVVGWVVGW